MKPLLVLLMEGTEIRFVYPNFFGSGSMLQALKTGFWAGLQVNEAVWGESLVLPNLHIEPGVSNGVIRVIGRD